MSLPPPEVGLQPPLNQGGSSIRLTNNPSTSALPVPVTQDVNESLPLLINQHMSTTATSPLENESTFVSCTNSRDFGVMVHHENKESYVLSQYCLPVNVGTIPDVSLCKFGERECIVHKSNLVRLGKPASEVSSTTYTPSDEMYPKFGYRLMDTRMIKCFYPNCINKKTNRDKIFHYACFMHSLKKVDNKQMQLLKLESIDDKLMGYIRSDNDMKPIVKSLLKTKNDIVLPVCGKRCYNWVQRYRTESIKEADKYGATNPNWDKDGVDGVSRSSSKVLIDWLTTEGNAVSYLGGSDKDGRTSSSRKETYHNLLSNMIKKENNSIRSPESIRNKISRIIDTFNTAHQRMTTTGAGTVGSAHQKFQDYIIDNVCRYYFELLPIMKDRPNVLPWFTNHGQEKSDSSSDESEDDEESVFNADVDSEPEIMITKVNKSKKKSKDNTYNKSFASTLENFNSIETVDDLMSSTSQSQNQTSNKDTTTRVSKDSTSPNSSRDTNNKHSSSSSKSRRKYPSDTISPIQAKELKKNIFKEKNNQINVKKRRGKASLSATAPDTNEREFFIEQRSIKMKFDLEVHNDLKVQHHEKMKLEKLKYEMQEKEMNIRLENEKSKKILSKVEIFKARIEFKKQDPNISDEFLDLHFPLS